MDGWTDPHSDYSADQMVVQYYNIDPRVLQDSHSAYVADSRVVQYSVYLVLL